MDENILTVQSSKFFDGIPLFMLRIYKNLRFETIHYGVKCYFSNLSQNHINTVDTWSKLEEITRYLNSMVFEHKKNILSQHFLAKASKMVGIKYSSDIVIRAFEYYATSRTLYNRIRDYFQLPSLATLGRMTSKVSKLNEKSFLLSIFNTLNTRQKGCIILHDEVYIKKMLLYHRKQLFGKSFDNPSLLAQTALGIMLMSQWGSEISYKIDSNLKINISLFI